MEKGILLIHILKKNNIFSSFLELVILCVQYSTAAAGEHSGVNKQGLLSATQSG